MVTAESWGFKEDKQQDKGSSSIGLPTKRGGKLLNNWRMAQIHAQEAPERVLELEEWGALFDRTKEGLILQRDFGGHRYARLAHVGDRTGLEMIRTLQQHAVHKRIDVYMECTIQRLLKDGERICGAFGYWRENGKFILFKDSFPVFLPGSRLDRQGTKNVYFRPLVVGADLLGFRAVKK